KGDTSQPVTHNELLSRYEKLIGKPYTSPSTLVFGASQTSFDDQVNDLLSQYKDESLLNKDNDDILQERINKLRGNTGITSKKVDHQFLLQSDDETDDDKINRLINEIKDSVKLEESIGLPNFETTIKKDISRSTSESDTSSSTFDESSKTDETDYSSDESL